ncbi:MAG: DHH family phosphoesterase [bacterium]
MPPPNTPEIIRAILNSRSILLTTKERYQTDDLASLTALALFLKKLGKPFQVAVSNVAIETLPKFLTPENLTPKLNQLRDFVIAVDLKQHPLQDISYDVTGERLILRLVPEDGAWTKADISVGGSGYKFDLIISCGAPDRPELGQIFERNPEFFYSTPIVNLDHDTKNERFGTYNAVVPTVAAVSEVVFGLMKAIDSSLIDSEIATCLLSGILTKTQSFHSPKIVPKTLEVTAGLLSLGADQKKIISELFRKRTVPMLSLWGRALARLKQDSAWSLAWTTLTREDFLTSGADEKSLHEVAEEFILAVPEVKIALLFWEKPDEIIINAFAKEDLDLLEIFHPFKPVGRESQIKISIKDGQLSEVEGAIIAHLKQTLPKLSKYLSR